MELGRLLVLLCTRSSDPLQTPPRPEPPRLPGGAAKEPLWVWVSSCWMRPAAPFLEGGQKPPGQREHCGVALTVTTRQPVRHVVRLLRTGAAEPCSSVPFLIKYVVPHRPLSQTPPWPAHAAPHTAPAAVETADP